MSERKTTNATGRIRTGNKSKSSLLQPRNGSSQIWAAIASAILLLCSVMAARSPETPIAVAILVELSVLPSFMILVEVLHRLSIGLEERQYLSTRYNYNYQSFLKDICYASNSLLATFAVFTFFFVIVFLKFDKNPWLLWYEFGPVTVILSLCGSFLLTRVLKLDSGPLYQSLWLSNSAGLDYGSGMAHSFFHGYLKLIIPKTGTDEKHMEELMQDYEARERVQLECYKVFILIPKSLHCFTSLKDKAFPSIEESKSLVEKQITVAGVQRRVYKNSIYKIKSGNERKYVAAEYATPLKTFKDVYNYNGEHSDCYKKHKDEIALQFYLTLKKILNEQDTCRGYCELIYYDDREKNHYRDVGQILLEKIEEIKRKEAARRVH